MMVGHGRLCGSFTWYGTGYLYGMGLSVGVSLFLTWYDTMCLLTQEAYRDWLEFSYLV